MTRSAVVVWIAIGVLGPLSSRAEDAPSPGPGFDVAYIDRAADPCTDFYQYACGGWLAKNPLPPDQPRWNRGYELYLRNGEIVRGILEKAGRTETTRDPLDQRIGDDYASCMDEAGIEALGTKPLQSPLALVSGLRGKARLPMVLAQLRKQGVDAVFDFTPDPDFKDANQEMAWIDQAGLALPDRDYYLNADEKSVALRKAYTTHVSKMLELSGLVPRAAAADAAAAVALETALAKVSADRVSRRDPATLYHPMTRTELKALVPGFDWDRYFTAMGAPSFERLSVTSPDFLKGVALQLRSASLAEWKAYLRWHVVHAQAPLLPKAFVEENFAFYGHTLKGAQAMRPRWQTCMQSVESDLGDALGRRYVEATVGAEGKERILRMVVALRGALEKDIEGLSWMTDKTRQAALEKLRTVAVHVVFPDHWRDYAGLEIVRGAAVANHQRAAAFEAARQLGKIGRPVDKDEWPFPPTTMNAGYEAQANSITFTAAILQPPFYENRLDDAVNMGAIGAVIGHELTHGFDDEGRHFDGAGNLRDWWTEDDAREFETRAGCFVEQYGGYTAVGEQKLDGKLTLGENTADNGGVRMAYQALAALSAGKAAETIDGFTPAQRFFLGFGQITCERRTDEIAAMLVRVDPHSPGLYRVRGVVSNLPEFRQAFGCKADAPMVRENACRVW
jgi:putative endopeptidase